MPYPISDWELWLRGLLDCHGQLWLCSCPVRGMGQIDQRTVHLTDFSGSVFMWQTVYRNAASSLMHIVFFTLLLKSIFDLNLSLRLCLSCTTIMSWWLTLVSIDKFVSLLMMCTYGVPLAGPPNGCSQKNWQGGLSRPPSGLWGPHRSRPNGEAVLRGWVLCRCVFLKAVTPPDEWYICGFSLICII